MAGLPGGGRGPGGVPKFVSAPATKPVGDSTTYVARAPTFVPTWRSWVPPGGIYGFIDYSIGFSPTIPPDTTHILRAPTFTPTWQPWRLENRGFAQSVPLTLRPPGVVVAPFSQDDWPNPRSPQRSVDLLTWTQSLSASGLLQPFAQDDWPNPVRPRPVIITDWIADTNLGLLRPDVSPFSQDDWPNPRGAQRGQDFVASTNLGLLRPDVNPFIPHDWANPRLALQPITDWTQASIRAAVVVQAPFAQYDWPLPRAPLNLALYKFTDYFSGLGVQVGPPPPIRQYDWPNPWGAKPSIGLLTWTQSPAVPPVVVDTTHILRAPVYTPTWQPYRIVNFDWSQSVTALNLPSTVIAGNQPRVPAFVPTWQPWQTRSYVSWTDYYSIQVIPPPTNYDQSNPRWPQPNRADWIQSTTLTLRPVGVVQAPLVPRDWPIPRGWPAPHVGFASGINLGLLRPDINPFAQDDWPNRSVEPRRSDWIQSAFLALTTVVVTPQPFAQADWPNPRAALRGPADYVAGTNLGVLRPDVNPEINYDWPNPQAARRVVADWIQSAFAALATAPPPPTPFAQTDWPNPRGAVGVHTGFAAGTNQGLLRPELNPFAQRDWQNPRGAVGSHVGFAAATQLNLLRPDVNPFLPRDLPNPRAPLRSIDLYGWVQALSALIIPPPPPPTFPPNGQYNWPNPAGPQRGIDLFGWSQSPTALTLPETIIPPPEVLQPGGRGVPHTFSRKKWRELQMLIAAEMAAVAKAEELTKRDKREALLAAARAAAAAVDAAEAEGENKRLDKLLVRNALTLRAAIRAASEVKLLRETASAIEQSRAIVQRQQDEEDEMINLLMLS